MDIVYLEFTSMQSGITYHTTVETPVSYFKQCFLIKAFTSANSSEHLPHNRNDIKEFEQQHF